MEPDQQLALSATAAVAAIAGGDLTATAYTTTLLDRAEQLTDRRAVITLNRAGALASAARIDDARRSGTALGRLAGLPVIVKDNINTKDLPTTAGTPALHDFRPTEDAAVLRPLLDAGAIILGKANMHELAFGITTTNFAPFAGTTTNPYDPSRIPGGSSGGTGAAIAARIAPAGLGSDTGASVRIPAAFNGIAGLRPSTGGRRHRYSGTGVCPLSHTLDTVGPMARTVADVALLDSVITGAAITPPARLDGLRVGVPAALWSGLEGEVNTVMQAAKRRLADAGVVFVDADLPDILALSEKVIFPVALHEPIADIAKYLEDSGATGITVTSIIDQIASPDVKKTFEVVLADAMAAAYPDAVNVYRPQLQRMYSAYFADNSLDALVFPTSPVLPAPIDPVNGTGTLSIDGGPPVDTFTTTIRNMGPGSSAGVPSLSLPAGMSACGLPVGLNLEGPIDGDSTILAIGMAIESLLGPLPAPEL
jgi:indoleacetamide hydrolase